MVAGVAGVNELFAGEGERLPGVSPVVASMHYERAGGKNINMTVSGLREDGSKEVRPLYQTRSGSKDALEYVTAGWTVY